MYQTLFYVNDDWYDQPSSLRLHAYRRTEDPLEAQAWANSYREAFRVKNFQALHMVMIKLEPQSGVFEVLLNEYGTHPLKQIKEINPKAAEIQKARPKRMSFADFVPAPPIIDDNNQVVEEDEDD